MYAEVHIMYFNSSIELVLRVMEFYWQWYQLLQSITGIVTAVFTGEQRKMYILNTITTMQQFSYSEHSHTGEINRMSIMFTTQFINKCSTRKKRSNAVN